MVTKESGVKSIDQTSIKIVDSKYVTLRFEIRLLLVNRVLKRILKAISTSRYHTKVILTFKSSHSSILLISGRFSA